MNFGDGIGKVVMIKRITEICKRVGEKAENRKQKTEKEREESPCLSLYL